MNRSDRILGCLVGGMLGDAIGANFEGLPPPVEFQIPRHLGVTDDSQLTLATCESIIEQSRVDPESIASHFLGWFRERRITGIGSSTLKAMTELDAGGHWAMVGASGERAAGNGAAMRIAPLAFFLDCSVSHAKRTIRDVCRITHRNDEAYLGALAILLAIKTFSSENSIGMEVARKIVECLPDCRVRDRLALVAEKEFSVAEYQMNYQATGYVVDSVPLSILAAAESTDFLLTVKQLVEFGGDTDTVCSMFGQIYGAANGMAALPIEIAERVDGFRLTQEIAQKLESINVV